MDVQEITAILVDLSVPSFDTHIPRSEELPTVSSVMLKFLV